MTTSTAVASALRAALPEGVVGPATEAYEIDGLRPSCAVRPRSIDEVAAAMGAASASRAAVIPLGGMTLASVGNIPARYDVALDLTALDRIVEYSPEDLTVTVEAGARLADLNAALAERGQFLPFDPPVGEGATIGGIVAANATGPSRHAYDAPRDRLIGISTVHADGTVTKAGGRVVKNVAGYDLCKLYCGSMGTLAVIVSATFKVAPLPRAEKTYAAAFGSAHEAAAFAFHAIDSGLALRSVEVVSPAAARSLSAGDGWTALLRCSGGPAAVERSLSDLRTMRPDGRIVGEDVWTRYPALDASAPVVLRLSPPPSDVAEALTVAGPDAVATATLAHGIARFALPDDRPDLREFARLRGGAWVLERAPLDLKSALDVWGPARSDFDLMRRVKREYDPAGVLSPGRFVGRL